jgi:hypothetical protein
VNAKHEKYASSERRKITETWTTPENYRVKVYTYHDKVKKSYWSIISECAVSESGTSGIYFERHSMHVDLNRLISSTPAARYDFRKLEHAHNLAAASVESLVSELVASHEMNA